MKIRLNSDNSKDIALFGYGIAAVLILALIPLKAPLYWHGTLLLISLSLVLSSKVSALHLISRALLIIPGLVAALLILPVIGGETQMGAATALKLTGIMLLLSWMTWKLPPHRMFNAMESLRFPTWLVEILRSTYKNLCMLIREVFSMRKALKSRTVHRGLWLIKTAGNMVSLLFLKTQERAAYQIIARDLRNHDTNSPTMEEPTSIQIENVSYRYKEGNGQALHGICLEITPQSKVAILGCNGAGKTTLLLQLSAVLPLQSGRIEISGLEMNRENRARIRKEVGMLFQNPDDQILGLTVEEDVAIGPKQLPILDTEKDSIVESSLRQVGLWNQRHQTPHRLSGGERKRLAIAGLFSSGSRILLLDEPMASLDPPGRDEITVLLEDAHRSGHTIVAATHDVDFAAEWANIIVIMENGHVIASGTPDILTNSEIMGSAGLKLPRVSQAFNDLEKERPSLEKKIPRTQEEALNWLRDRSRIRS